MGKARKKYRFIGFCCPANLKLTEAKKIIGLSKVNKLEVGQSIEFRGIGNFYNFTVQRFE
jgi:hypothetical protein